MQLYFLMGVMTLLCVMCKTCGLRAQNQALQQLMCSPAKHIMETEAHRAVLLAAINSLLYPPFTLLSLLYALPYALPYASISCPFLDVPSL